MASTSAFLFLSVASTIGGLLGIAGEILLLAVVMTVVRRHRPDVWRSLFGWALTGLVGGVVYRVASFVVIPIFARVGGTESVITGQAITSLLGTCLHVATVLLLARGLVALAQPPKPPVVAGDGAYR